MGKIIAGIVVGIILLLGIGAAVVVINDLNGLKADVRDIAFKMGDMENVLRGRPDASTISTLRQRVNIVRDDLRMLSIRHPIASAVFKNEAKDVWDRFERVENQLRSLGTR